MKKEAEEHAAEDSQKKEVIEVKNLADSLVFQTEKALKDAGDKVGDEVKKQIEEKVEALKKVKGGDDLETIKKATEELTQTAQKLGEAMYAQQQAQSQQTAQQPAGSEPAQEKTETKEGGTVEAEYEEVKEDDKK